MYQLKQYIKFLLRSTNQHGVHSPFVYNLVTKCFYDNKDYTEYQELKKFREVLLKNNHSIEVQDLGFGSKKTKSNIRKISELTSTSGSSLKRTKLLFRLAKYFKSDNILELGTSMGISTQSLCLGSPKANIISIEGCPNISNFTRNQLSDFKNLQIITGDFSQVIPELAIDKLDIVYFDGNHQKDATLEYWEMLLPKAHNDSIFIFDDIYWSKGMTEAWEIIKQHPKAKVTIDTFQWGFVFFREEQAKEDFVIRV